MIPELGVGDVGKSVELAADTLWDVGLTLLGLYGNLDGLRMFAHGLGFLDLHVPQALCVMLLGKKHVHQELGIHSL